ncbi:MAG: MATE family efflux transporter [Alistipes sp.]|nr:MATE family efflux transporter [Alistipes sp.]
MRFFSTYRSFYKENLQLAFPVILSQIGQITVQMADTAMVGNYGGDDPTPLAAVSFATNLFYIIFITSLGLTFGLTPLVGERFAQKRDRHVRELLQNGLLLFSLIGVAATLLLVLLRGMFPIMASLMMGGDADASIGGVVDMAIPYYNTLIWSLFPVMIWGTIKQFLEGVGNTRVAMVTIIIANSLNILLNWIFIFGKCGFEPMGAVGAGYATLISRVVQCLMMVVYFFRAKRFRIYTEGLLKRSMIKFRRIAEILKVGIPISFHMFMEASAFVVAGIMVLAFGAASVSAYQIGVNMMNLTFMIVIAIGSSTTILCSHIYGNRDFSRLRRTVNAAYQMGLLWNISVATLFVAFRYQIPTLFTTNVQTIEITADMLIFISLFQVSDCLQAISISIMRGLQDVKVLMPIVFVSYVVINIPVAYLLAFECGFKTNGLIMGFIVGLSCCAVMTIRRVRKNIKRLEMSVEN